MASATICASGCAGDEMGSAGTTQGAGSTSAAQSTGSAGSGKQGPVVFNEISARSPEWLELGNASDAEVDLAAFGVCDSDATGQCDLTKSLRFPSGTKLAPGAYLLILGNQAADAGAGPHSECLANGPSNCFFVTWKVSASNGETVFLISPKDEVVSDLRYPPNAAAVGQTWGRLPDLKGDATATTPTPGAPNAPPP